MRVTEQMVHERIGVRDLSCDGIQNENAIVGRLEQTAVADFRLAKSFPGIAASGHGFKSKKIILAGPPVGRDGFDSCHGV